MSSELDAEIARLEGWTQIEGTTFHMGVPPGTIGPRRYPSYSTDLNALMDLIRRRWPEAQITLARKCTILRLRESPWPERAYVRYDEPTDAERLAPCVRDALKAEAEAE